MFRIYFYFHNIQEVGGCVGNVMFVKYVHASFDNFEVSGK